MKIQEVSSVTKYNPYLLISARTFSSVSLITSTGYHGITELQELEGTSRDHWIQLPCKGGPLQQAAQVGIQVGLEYLQRGRIHNPSGQPVQCSVTLTVKKLFRILVWNFLCSRLWSLRYVLATWFKINWLPSWVLCGKPTKTKETIAIKCIFRNKLFLIKTGKVWW